jgi:quercetin dioxygenase-like cupin family protein
VVRARPQLSRNPLGGVVTLEHFRSPSELVGAIVLVASLTLMLASCATRNPALRDPLEAGWHGKPVCERLHEDHRQRVLRCTFPPGVGHERHFHDPHFGYAIAGGRMRITDGEGVREVDFPTGSSFSSEGVAWHEALNIGGNTTVFLIFEPK